MLYSYGRCVVITIQTIVQNNQLCTASTVGEDVEDDDNVDDDHYID